MHDTPDPARVLVVDDSASYTDLLTRMLTRQGFDVRVASSGDRALADIAANQPDVVLLDVMMPGFDGFETCRRIKANPETRMTPVVLVTGLDSRDSRIRGIEVGADDLMIKPPDWQELTARVRALVRLKRYTDNLESAESVMLSLAMTIELRDPYTEGHCQRLANYATALGERLGLADEDLQTLYQGGFLHDLGKVGIPDAILLKPGALADWELGLIRQHPVVGERLCDGLRSMRRVRPIIRHHHERRDGSGYPDGLSGDDIPLLAQIMSVVDVYDALTTERAYKGALSHDAACAVLRAEVRNSWWNRDLVDEFIGMDLRRLVPCRENDAMLQLRFSLESRAGSLGMAGRSEPHRPTPPGAGRHHNGLASGRDLFEARCGGDRPAVSELASA
jgi:putative two-component system response regulator